MTSYTSTFQELARTQERMRTLLNPPGLELAKQMQEIARSRQLEMTRISGLSLTKILEGFQPAIRFELQSQMQAISALSRIADLQSTLPIQYFREQIQGNLSNSLRLHVSEMSRVYCNVGWVQSLVTLPTLNASRHIHRTANLIQEWEEAGREVEPLVASITCTEAEVIGQGDEIAEYADAFDFEAIEPETNEADSFSPTQNLHFVQRSELIVAIRRNPDFLTSDDSIDGLFTSQYSACSRAVCSYVTQINRFCKAIGREPIFKLTEELVQSLVALPNILAVRRPEFGEFLDYVYFIVYEGAGKDKLRFLDLIDKDEAHAVWRLKHLRNLYSRHDVEHGKEKEIEKKRTRLAEVFVELIDKPLPRFRADFGNAQLAFVRQIEQMLRLIYDRLERQQIAGVD